MPFLSLPIPSLVTPKQTVLRAGAIGVVAAFPGTRIAIIAPKRLTVNPVLARLLDQQKRKSFRLFLPSWVGEPTLEGLKGTLAEIEEFGPDVLVAIGGGSLLDGSKLIWAFYEHPHFPIDRLDIPFSLPPLRRRAQFCAAPTTAGTGSEASSAAILSDSVTGKKIPVVTHDFLPDLAILDPDLLIGLPKAWIAIPALDALAHAIEGLVSTIENPIAESLVLQAVRHLLNGLEILRLNERATLGFQDALLGSFLAGLVQNMKLVGVAHALAHQLGKTGVPHGLATGLLLPAVMEFNAQDTTVRMKYEALARDLHLQSFDDLLGRLRAIPEQFGIDPRLSRWERATKPTEDVGRAAAADKLARVFPVPVTPAQANDLFEKVW